MRPGPGIDRDRFWAATALALIGTAITLILADVAWWLGAVPLALGFYVAVAAFFIDLPLPQLISERRHAAFEVQRVLLIEEGMDLADQRAQSPEDVAAIERDYEGWFDRCVNWLEVEAPASAPVFRRMTGTFNLVMDSYSEPHSAVRLKILWRVQILRDL